MCMCGKPTINGTPGYSWDGKQTSTRQIDPPAIEDRDELLFDEPGRCGGIDAHCHHYRIVLRYGQLFLLVRHGGGDERIPLSQCKDNLKAMLLSMDSNTRFWFMNSLYHTIHNHTEQARAEVRSEWSAAFVDKRIKKQKRKGTIRVWIEQPPKQQIGTDQLRDIIGNADHLELMVVRRQYADIHRALVDEGFDVDIQVVMAVVDKMASSDPYFVRLAKTVAV